jgi:ribose/xylose/arabinose/galactoside ABC-type transport system permease subunit
MTDTTIAPSPWRDFVRASRGLGVAVRNYYLKPGAMYLIAPALFVIMCAIAFHLQAEDTGAFEGLALIFGRVVKEGTPYALMAIGVSLVLATGGVDLSVASVAAVSSVVYAWSTQWNYAPWVRTSLGIAAVVTIGLASGLIVGFAVTRRRSSLIVSWAVGVIWTILAFTIATLKGNVASVRVERSPATEDPTFWVAGGHGFEILLIVLAIAIAVLRFSNIPTQARAIGANRLSAEYAGVPTRYVLIFCYMTSGVFAAVAGLFWCMIDNAGSTVAFAGRELIVISIAVLGGTVMTGGYLCLPSVAVAAYFWAITRTVADAIETPTLGSFQQHFANGIFASVFLAIMALFGARLAGVTSVIHIDQRKAELEK